MKYLTCHSAEPWWYNWSWSSGHLVSFQPPRCLELGLVSLWAEHTDQWRLSHWHWRGMTEKKPAAVVFCCVGDTQSDTLLPENSSVLVKLMKQSVSVSTWNNTCLPPPLLLHVYARIWSTPFLRHIPPLLWLPCISSLDFQSPKFLLSVETQSGWFWSVVPVLEGSWTVNLFPVCSDPACSDLCLFSTAGLTCIVN